MMGTSLVMIGGAGASFDFGSLGAITNSGDLRTISSNAVTPSFSSSIVVDEGNSLLYVSESILDANIAKFSYVDIEDLSSDVAYVESIDISSYIGAITTIKDIKVINNGDNAYILNQSGTIYYCAMSTAFDFETISLVSSGTITDISNNSNLTYSTLRSINYHDGGLWVCCSESSDFKIVKCSVPSGDLSNAFVPETSDGMSGWTIDNYIDIEQTTNKQFTNFCESGATGDVYGLCSVTVADAAPGDIVQYVDGIESVDIFDVSTELSITGGAGIQFNADGSRVFIYNATTRKVYSLGSS